MCAAIVKGGSVRRKLSSGSNYFYFLLEYSLLPTDNGHLRKQQRLLSAAIKIGSDCQHWKRLRFSRNATSPLAISRRLAGSAKQLISACVNDTCQACLRIVSFGERFLPLPVVLNP